MVDSRPYPIQDIIPHKIKYGDYLKMMMEGDDSDCEVISSSSDSDDSSDDDVIPVLPDS